MTNSEIDEIYAELKKISQAKRASNRARSTQILINFGVKFESKNMGAHLVVNCRKGIIDFWPGTGKFITRETKKQGRGVRHLLKLC